MDQKRKQKLFGLRYIRLHSHQLIDVHRYGIQHLLSDNVVLRKECKKVLKSKLVFYMTQC